MDNENDTIEFIDTDDLDTVDGQENNAYDMSQKKLCYIISNEEFQPHLNLSTRSGTDKDFKQLRQVFKTLKFEVEPFKNCTCRQINENLKQLSQRKDLDGVSMMVCIILSHGDEGIIYGTDGIVELDRLFGYFKGDKCKGLIGKPKIFFIQACRGQKYDKGVSADSIISNYIEKIPIEADFLIGYSTVPGYFSWRNGASGSWYIQALCKELIKCSKTHELVQLLVKVNNNVATNFKSKTNQKETDGMVQISSFVCMLRKSLWFS
uniref:Caspase-3B n=1 Tax=Dugesia japonica TaxID=6161 RepID=A0A4Y6I1H4_DUGJA|nr:caspase-3B [Dugesia japonica]